MGLLDGKVAIVTGAGGGLGEAYANLFAKEGAAVVVNDLGTTVNGSGVSAAAEKVVAAIVAAGGRAVSNSDDVSTLAGGENILRAALDAFGQVDILICNAGILRDRTFANTAEEDWDAVMKVHLKGTYCCTRPVWTWLKDNRRPGVIIMTSSTSGLFGNFGQANYGAAKAGIYGFMRVLSIEGRKYGIRVMAVAPNAVTRMWARIPGTEAIESDRPALLPENVAPGVLFMASDLAAEHSGKVLAVSGEEISEVKMLTAEGFRPKGAYTASDVAAHAASVFFPTDPSGV
ncbi:SDR family NAD(P)-dependent oxidoreductase [Bradyrhizobium sp. 35]|uniref:SDR family NAD(P)-dependent oxidoreductase n=1 Tax=unclassified Bradyrhizobium TaxID=2631580 RepID=UPI00036F6281|nr:MULTISPECIES: SDR family NAD(P)-dependent oxidoreductase [unclassified Bradyrhizobium]MCK1450507.1 SDR family NAD(P)-dependent oxidoreductase [Bradyrhizobium sp. 35]MCK1479636.1 SDR family NAD(P)-dependent oxidoreductase [Bradyrhizobium sp. 197]MCK1518846.1 SDR family NAD(P)-dependent oxidoreductase [Bradyrhizobium sp. 17]